MSFLSLIFFVFIMNDFVNLVRFENNFMWYVPFTLILFSFVFFILGIVGVYLGRVFKEVKRRPLYIIADRC